MREREIDKSPNFKLESFNFPHLLSAFSGYLSCYQSGEEKHKGWYFGICIFMKVAWNFLKGSHFFQAPAESIDSHQLSTELDN
uniref:Uncharacterized protein n=1 Tax=Nelumbo nucifera TaxID=4432 RepID=A0A822XHL8_NELNU|nr:TPA_asm: hypothetical protein HUJ06_020915 [Nelumbo nucifera]